MSLYRCRPPSQASEVEDAVAVLALQGGGHRQRGDGWVAAEVGGGGREEGSAGDTCEGLGREVQLRACCRCYHVCHAAASCAAHAQPCTAGKQLGTGKSQNTTVQHAAAQRSAHRR